MKIATYQPVTIVNDVRPMSSGDYQDAVQEFVERFRREFRSPAAFYHFGSVSSPGISDIDLLIVCADELWESAYRLAEQIRRCSDRMEYLFIHPLDVVGLSALPHMDVMHTLHKLTPLEEVWDPVFDRKRTVISEEVSFVRHAVWNSCFRATAPIFLDTETVSLRQVLIRLNNLLASALLGNAFLESPVDIPFEIADVRRTIMAAADENRRAVCLSYISSVLDVLSEVDRAIDRSFGSETLIHATTIQPTHHCRCVAPLEAAVRDRMPIVSSNCPGGWVIQVPQYVVDATVGIALHAASAVPALRSLCTRRDLPLRRHPGVAEFSIHLQAAYRLCAGHNVPFVWPMPFGIRSDQGARERILFNVRRLVGAASFATRMSL